MYNYAKNVCILDYTGSICELSILEEARMFFVHVLFFLKHMPCSPCWAWSSLLHIVARIAKNFNFKSPLFSQ